MTVVIGTAGHIDHGKTALLRALTGIDADRLPEERRRGMTIEVGYAWVALPDGTELDFVDVPGHDRLVGNMLVGAGEIDAAMLIVAADEGPQAQTLEHLELLDALRVADGLAVVTKLDLLGPEDPRRAQRVGEVTALLAQTTLAGSQVLSVSALSGEGVDELRGALADLSRRVADRVGPASRSDGDARLSIDRVFTARGRGAVVTGTLRGGRVERGGEVRIEPGARRARIRDLQVHGQVVEAAASSGRLALNLAGIQQADLARGMVVATGPAVLNSDRLLVTLRVPRTGASVAPPRRLTDGAELRLHIGTDEVICRVRLGPVTDGPSGDQVALLRLARPVGAALDDRFVLRWPSPAGTAAGGRVIDPLPTARVARRSIPQGTGSLGTIASAEIRLAELVRLHGAMASSRYMAYAAALDAREPAHGRRSTDSLPQGVISAGGLVIDAVLAASLPTEAVVLVVEHGAAHPLEPGMALTSVREALVRSLRRAAVVPPRLAREAVDAVLDEAISTGRLARTGDLVRDPGRVASVPEALAAAMDRLQAALRSAAPPSLAEAARAAACPPEGLRLLESDGRIIRVGPDLAYEAEAYRKLEAMALRLAAAGPLTPAVFRDGSGTSRKYALAILEELDARGLLRRGPDGHRLGPKAPRSP